MRFDVPLVSFALLGAASAAAFGPPGHGGWGNDRQTGGVEHIEEEIEHLEEKLQHDLEELERHEAHHHHGRPPFFPGTPAPYVPSSVAAAPTGYPSDNSSVLASLSSVKASLSSAISIVSSVNATATLASSTGTASASLIPSGSANSTVPVGGSSTGPAPYYPVSSLTSSSASEGSPASYSAAGSSSVSAVSYDQTTVTSSVAGVSPTSYAAGASSSTSSDTCTDEASTYVASSSSAIASATAVASSGSAPSYATGASSSVAIPSDVYSSGSAPSSYVAPASSSAVSASNVYYTSESTVTVGSTVIVSPVVSESTSYFVSASSPTSPVYPYGNYSTSGYATGSAPSGVSSYFPTAPTSAFLTGTATSMAPTSSATVPANTTSSSYCSNLCSSLTFDTDYATYPVSCEYYAAGSTIEITGGQLTAQCGTTITPEVDLCRVVLTVTTSGSSESYMEVWMPNGNTTSWNGRTLSTDNGGANGCVAFDDMQYVTGLGFAAIGDNGGHNNSAFDGGWMYFNNEAILDWGWRARHSSVQAGKQVVAQFYEKQPTYSYYLGCSTGGQQGMHSAQYFPGDFDGIIAGSAAADFNHLQGWSNRFIQMTGTGPTDDRFLTEDQWILVQSYLLAQCDAALDGVNDGIIEDPTICEFNSSAIPICAGNSTDSCLTSTQITTVDNVFSQLYDTEGDLLYPSMLYGSQVDAFRLGMLSGSPQAIATDFYGGGVWNNSYYDYIDMNQTDYAQATALDELHGYISTMKADLSEFQAAGAKMITYHGLADPLVSAGNSQKYYLKVAQTMGQSPSQLDDFYRFFRISGMAHCGVGGISGAGAWMFGQSGAADVDGVGDNIIWNMVDWVENGNAPDTILGTKYWYDEPSLGLEFQRAHCRFPYRTTYDGTGDPDLPGSWSCVYITDWQECGVGAHPRLCNSDGSFS